MFTSAAMKYVKYYWEHNQKSLEAPSSGLNAHLHHQVWLLVSVRPFANPPLAAGAH